MKFAYAEHIVNWLLKLNFGVLEYFNEKLLTIL